MAINENPMFAWEQDLTPEQLAQMLALIPKDYVLGQLDPNRTLTADEAGGMPQFDVVGRGWSLPGEFGPSIGWNPGEEVIGGFGGTDEITRPTVDGGSWAIGQARNASTWGNSDVSGAWDGDGKWQGWNSGATDLRGLANFVMQSVGGYYGANALNGVGGGLSGLDAAMVDMGAGATNVGAGAAAGGGAVAGGGIAGGSGLTSGGSSLTSGLTNAGTGGISNSVGGAAAGTGAAAGGGIGGLSPGLIRTGVGLGTTLLTQNSGGGNQDLSQVNPADLATFTQNQNQNTWQQQLNASRYNSITPEGSSTWSQTPQFNQGAYDQAMQAWQAAGNPNLPQPTREQFTTQQWTNTQALSPEAQALKDAQRNVQTQAAQGLPGQAGQYLNRVNQGVDRSGIPDFKYTAATQQQGQLGHQALPTYGQVSGPGAMSNPTFGDINRGAIQSTTDKTARDWASTVQGDVTDWNRQLAALDPWMFDQQGSEAMYNMSTRYMLPQQQAEKTALESRLGEQGFVPGTPAYDSALKQILDSQGLAQADARDRALLAGREYGNQAFDNKAGALSSAAAGMLNFGDLGLRTDAASFGQNMDLANLANAAQQQDFNQQNVLSQQQFAEGTAANQVVKDLFGMNLDTVNTNNKWAGQDFTDLLNLTGVNNKAIGANNDIALQLAQLNNAAVGQARGQANTDFLTDVGAQRNASLDLLNASGVTPTAPGPGTAQVPGMNQADISSMLQNYFNNNVDLQNASTAERNAIINALGSFLTALVGDK